MNAQTKKTLVGMGAVASTIVSVVMWLWYASLPSFDKTKCSFNNTNTTWEEAAKCEESSTH